MSTQPMFSSRNINIFQLKKKIITLSGAMARETTCCQGDLERLSVNGLHEHPTSVHSIMLKCTI